MTLHRSSLKQSISIFFLLALSISGCQAPQTKTVLSGRKNEEDLLTTSPSIEAPSQRNPIAALGSHAYFDRPDDSPRLYQFHVLYVVTKDFKLTSRDLDGSIDEEVRLVNAWFSEQTGGQTIRFDTYHNQLDITFVILPITESEFLSYVAKKYEKFDTTYHGIIFLHYALEDWLNESNKAASIFSPGKLYITFFESSLAYVCGDGPVAGSRIVGLYPSAFNLRDQNNCKAFLGTQKKNKPGVWENILAHEIIHSLGFPSSCAKNLDSDGVHIDDPSTLNDIMGTKLGIYDKNPVLDPNHDDYYKTNSSDCPDLSNSPFLSPLPELPSLSPNVLSNPNWRLK